MTELTQLHIEGCGWLPIVKIDSVEVYRGEYQRSSMEAYQKCKQALAKRELDLTNTTKQGE